MLDMSNIVHYPQGKGYVGQQRTLGVSNVQRNVCSTFGKAIGQELPPQCLSERSE